MPPPAELSCSGAGAELAEHTCLPLQVPVGRETLGRIINVLGEPVDEVGPVSEFLARLVSPPCLHLLPFERTRLPACRRKGVRAHSPRGAAVRGAVHGAGDPDDRHQGAVTSHCWPCESST